MYCRKVESANAAGVRGAPPTSVQVWMAPEPTGENIKSLPVTTHPSGSITVFEATPRTVFPTETGAELIMVTGVLLKVVFRRKRGTVTLGLRPLTTVPARTAGLVLEAEFLGISTGSSDSTKVGLRLEVRVGTSVVSGV